MTPDYSVYLVTDPAARAGVIETVQAAVAGGATMVQLRDKDAPDAVFLTQAQALKALLDPLGVPLIVNDRVGIAARIGAAGVHVGQSDTGVAEAREAMGPDALVGLSIETEAQLGAVPWHLVDYIGASPVKGTPTKPDHAAPLGFEGLATLCRLSPKPVVAIGGLAAADAAATRKAGAAGMAVVSAICNAPDPEAAAREISDAWRQAAP